MAKVLVTPRPFHQSGDRFIKLLESHGHAVVVNDLGRRYTRDELALQIHDADAIITGNDPLDEEMLAGAAHLKVISKYGVGLDNIDVSWCEKNGIWVFKALGANSTAVAEDTILLMLASLRNFYQLTKAAKGGEDVRLMGREAEGKTLGLVGVGAIGKKVAALACALGMSVLGYDPMVEQKDVPSYIKLVDLDPLLSAGDIISLHLPLNDSTCNIVDTNFLSKMQRGAVLINTSRGGIVSPEALYDAMASGILGYVAEDIEICERPPQLVAMGNYLITPHAASFTFETDEKTMATTVDNVLKVID